MGADESSSGQLITQARELTKSFTSLDGSGRPAFIVTAPADAQHGSAATRVDYEYDLTYTTTVIKMRETNTTWDSSYDI